MPDSYVLDSFALLAYLCDEAGRSRVVELLRRAEEGDIALLLCIVNYGEVLYIVERARDIPMVKEVVDIIDNLPIQVVDVDRKLTFVAAHVKAQHSMSYADTFAVALAMRESAVVVTGDPEFRSVEELVQVEWISS